MLCGKLILMVRSEKVVHKMIFFQVMQTDGSYVYYLPDYQTGYSSPTPFVHGALISPDGQYYSPGLLSPTASYCPEWFPAYTWDRSLLSMDGFQGNAVTGKPIPSKSKVATVKPISEMKGSPSSEEHSLKSGNKVIQTLLTCLLFGKESWSRFR
jgi:hypothetical protein